MIDEGRAEELMNMDLRNDRLLSSGKVQSSNPADELADFEKQEE